MMRSIFPALVGRAGGVRKHRDPFPFHHSIPKS
jgi:hypothetical protein